MKGISVIICCYNSAARLPQTFAHLAKQSVNVALKWEVVLVNNDSSDETPNVADRLWKSLGGPVSLRIVNELNPGLSHARERGMSVAKYELFLWCDDDNWLCDTYVQTAFDIMETHQEIGALGGWCEAAFEGEKPGWFDQQAHFFAVSKQGRSSGDITLKKGCLYGAGMVLRKTHWLQLRQQGFKHLLSDRIGKKLNSGGDTEYTYALRLMDYKIWFDERLYFQHFIDDGRLNLTYLSRLRKARTHANFITWSYLDLLNGNPRSKSELLAYAFKGGIYRFIRQLGALSIGTYEQKQVAIRYFMFIKYSLFNYGTYKESLLMTTKWLNNKKSI
jgi:glycosyltransferase involved in cell wall biosynthesis